ncbi:hypothetical protein LTR86_009821 [Recurvomyces mirabilis]|nr:hypothetical protein LTR86_009821 [Recurvomyces mirabilis]
MAGTHSTNRYLYEILTARPSLPISRKLTALDASDGFIHLSTSEQTSATASRFFASESTIWLAKLDRAKLEFGPGELKWEASKNHGVFAHLYDADIDENTVAEVKELSRADGQTWDDILSDLEP